MKKMKNEKIQHINLNKLKLDFKNPRLPIAPSSEDTIIKWMLEDASILELMLAIGQNGFFIGEALLVMKDNDKFIVLEGNRRLTALKILDNPKLATIRQRKIEQILDETIHKNIVDIPCIIFEKREDILKYLGYRHVTGVKSWGILAKAKYLYHLKDMSNEKNLKKQARELAKQIGSRSDYVIRLITGYEIYKIIEDNGFYKIPKLDKTTFHFNYIADALRYENINLFIGINLDSDIPSEKLDKKNLNNLIHWFFEKNSQNRSRVLGDSDNLQKLNKLLSNSEVTKKFIDGLSLEEAYNLVEVDSGTFTEELYSSLQELKTAHSYIHQIQKHNDRDIEILGEIVNLCKVIKNTINSKDDDWTL